MTDVLPGPADPTADVSWRRYRSAEQNVPEMVYETDTQGIIRWVSASATELLGWLPEHLVGTFAPDLVHPMDLDRVNAIRSSLYSEGRDFAEIPCLFQKADGTYRSVTVRARPLLDGAATVIGSIIRLTDTHDRDSMLRALTTMSQANRTLVRATDEATLLQDTCETIVTVGHYLFAWYGRPGDDPDQTVVPIAQAGKSDGYLDEVRISWADNEYGRGPTGTCLRLRETRIANSPENDPDFTPWIEPARRRGFRSSISLPVFVGDDLDGTLVVYAAEPAAFNALAQDLLEDLAADLGYGLHRLRALAERDDVVRQLTESESQLRLLAENASDVIMLSTADMTLTWVSPSAVAAFGYPMEELIGRNAGFLIHPDDLPLVVAEVQRTDADRSNLHVRHRLVRADGSVFWVDVAAGHIDDDGNGSPGRVVQIRDVDAQVRAEQELQAREAQYRLLAENASDVIVLLDDTLTITWVSPSVRQVLGFEADDLVGLTSADLIHPEDSGGIREGVFESETTGRPLVMRYRMRRIDDTYRWVESIGRPALDEHTGARRRIIAIRDVEEHVAARQQLEHALGHDQLTGLPTRQTMVTRIAALRDELARFHVVGVLCIGVDGLSEVNEALTHAAGDLLLTSIAARIVAAAPGVELVGRGSGNELVVLLPALRNGADAGALAESVRLAAQGPITITGHALSPTISVGIATGGSDADPEQLLRDASLALRKAKDNGRDRCEFADPGLAIEAQHRLALDSEIRAGLEANQFVPWFQPIVNLDSRRVVGYEALVRWIKPGGEGQPLSFLNVAERSSLILEIDLTVLRQSIEALATLPAAMFVSVNVSAITLARAPYADEVMRALSRTNVDPSRLHLEVTETMLLNPTDSVVECIGRLASLGVRWYIDDFGTGYASITSLRDLSMSGIKLDRSFTFGISSQDSTSMQLAQALIGLANGLHLDTVAEGVETQGQADYLRGLGWRHGQGWLFGKAAPLPKA